MWAQLIKVHVRAGKEQALGGLFKQLRAIEQPGSGLLRSLMMGDQKNPSQLYMMVVFGTEEHARAREHDPRRQEGLQAVRATMAEIFEGPPEFVDLEVLEELLS